MGIFSRIKDIAASNINDFKDKKFSDEKDIEEYITKLMLELADVKKSAADIFALETKLKRQSTEYETQIERFESLAKKAVAAGNEQDARAFLKKKHELETLKSANNTKYDSVHSDAEKIRQTHDQLVRQINDLQTRLKMLQSREAAADAQNIVNEANRNGGKVDSAFDQMEYKADAKSAKADAETYSYETDIDDEISEEIEKLKKENENK